MTASINSDRPHVMLQHHEELLRASAIKPSVAAARGYRSMERDEELSHLGFSAQQRRVPALLIPIHDVTGEVVTHQLRPDTPRERGGKAIKYETPTDSRMALDVPPAARDRLRDPSVPLYVTEGARKADAGVSAGLCCIALLGVWNFRGTNEHGGKTALPDWESIALNDRQVYLVFDSDVMTKAAVHAALTRLRGFLESRKARVKIVYLPEGPEGEKVGLDDYLAAGHSASSMLDLARSELKPPPGDAGDLEYFVTDEGTFWNKPTKDGPKVVRLANFSARIVRQSLLDDGLESELHYELEVSLNGSQRSVSVSAAAFGAMGWTQSDLGARAIVEPGFTLKDRLRTAIQKLSDEIGTLTVYRHTGWAQLPTGDHVFLHAGGAVGPEGPAEDVELRLISDLSEFELPAPPAGLVQTRRDFLECMGLLDLAPVRIMAPLLAAPFRSVLGGCDFAIYIHGSTGNQKSCLAALVQSFFSPRATYDHLPASWTSTGNYNEQLAFLAKDCVLVVDDFVATGTSADMARKNREADRLLRAQGNRSGRGRMNADSSTRQGRHPRGLIVSTGEDLPSGESLRARLLALEVQPGEVDLERLTLAQQAAAKGCYARLLSAFVRFVARNKEAATEGFQRLASRLREQFASPDVHPRLATAAGSILAAMHYLLDWGVLIEAIDDETKDRVLEQCRPGLEEVLRGQQSILAAADPAQLFYRLVLAALESGDCHVTTPKGDPPPAPDCLSLGWRRKGGSQRNDEYEPCGRRIGWIDDGGLYLIPDAALRAARALSHDSDRISSTPLALHRLLFDRGYIVCAERDRNRYTTRKYFDGKRTAVLHLRLPSAAEVAPSGPTVPASVTTPSGRGQVENSQLDDGARGIRGADRDGPAATRQVTPRPGIRSASGPAGPVGVTSDHYAPEQDAGGQESNDSGARPHGEVDMDQPTEMI